MYMEEEKILDPLNDVHLCSLHLVYIPRINQALKEFVSQYNDHPIRTEHNSSPRQLFCLGAHALPAVEGTDMDADDHYGVEEGGPVPELQTDDAVVVEPPTVHLNEQQEMILQHISNQISLVDDGNDGITHYLQTLQLLEHWLNSQAHSQN